MIEIGNPGSGNVKVHAFFSNCFDSSKAICNDGSSFQSVRNDFLGGNLHVAAVYNFCNISAADLFGFPLISRGGRQCL